MQWYYASGKNQIGPISEDELQSLVRKGTISSDTLVWNKTMTDWTKYRDVDKRKSSQEAVPDSTADAKKSSCSECGKMFFQDDMIQYQNSWVCPSCKPVFVQKLKEGLNVGGMVEYAGFWIRFVAVFLDGLILGLFQMIIFVPVMTIFIGRIQKLSSADSQDLSAMGPIFAIQALMWIVQISVAVAYETWFIGKYAATPGKMACRIKVINSDGTSVTYWRAFGRYFAKMISGIILGIGYIMAAFDKEKRALHDHICETRVVKK